MSGIRLGIIGVCGTIATAHRRHLVEVEGLDAVAGCDPQADRLAQLAKAEGFKPFDSAEAMIDSGEVDAVLVACPHYQHPIYARYALERGVHVLVEKPVAVTAREAAETDAIYEAARKRSPGLVYAAMFNQRTRSDWQLIKRLIDDGRLGELMRTSWTITGCYRTQRYYDSGGWRATWAGEGGGVLINQCPHFLDLFQWFVGVPRRVNASVRLGGHHHIEVEDEVSARLEFDNGSLGTFSAATTQSPGMNRIEIVGSRGTVIAKDDGRVTFLENLEPLDRFTHESPQRMGGPWHHTHEIECGGESPQHLGILRNFVDAIRNGDPLIAPATEGIRSLELGNAMLMSGLTGRSIEIPTDREAYAKLLGELIRKADRALAKEPPPAGA